MPVRSLNSYVLKWPDRESVDAAVRQWAQATARAFPIVVAIGYFGSYARGDWGPGSDVDIVIIGTESPVEDRYRLNFHSEKLPVPADVLFYTLDEWNRLGGRMGRMLREETVWVYGAPTEGPA
ncbi:MAG: nucleotidyltransferase domain-containing protein [Chloroflexi bacterium]|nr:nucleotidyltransferase domain-containing protein [Chloroflexota bacterium]